MSIPGSVCPLLTDMELLCLLSPIFLYLGVDMYFSVDTKVLCFFYCVWFIMDSCVCLSGVKGKEEDIGR